jgi:hypothetical protein
MYKYKEKHVKITMGYVAPFRLIILILTQPVSRIYCRLSGIEANINFIVYGLTQSGLETTTYDTRGEHANIEIVIGGNVSIGVKQQSLTHSLIDILRLLTIMNFRWRADDKAYLFSITHLLTHLLIFSVY